MAVDHTASESVSLADSAHASGSALTIRPCSPGDAAALSVVGMGTSLDAFAGLLPGEAVLAHCLKKNSVAFFKALLEDPASRAWLVEITGAPIGYAVLTMPDFPEFSVLSTDMELRRIYLLSRFHGSGVGRTLLNLAVDTAKEMGAARLLLGVHRENTRALAFYRRNSFLEVGVRTFRLGPKVFDDQVLGRIL